MKRTVKRAVLAVIVCALVVFALPALADSQARIVRLSYLDGSVQIDRNTGDGFERAITNMPITQGTRLATGEDGEAEIEFEDGSTIRLVPETRIEFPVLTLSSDGGKNSTVAVTEGTAYFDVQQKKDDTFIVAFSGHEISLSKSAHFRVEMHQQSVALAVFSGELKMRGSGESVDVKKNETLTFNLDNSDKYELAKGIDDGQFDWWDKEREQYHDQYAYRNTNNNGVYPSDVPYSYGWSDLNYYGSYFYLPGYGMVWRPYSVGYGWDPFAAGYWVWYPSFGYTWVSPYPWGWMPYRYGTWRFAGGYGWVWQPGYWNAWYPAPRVINPPSRYRPPAPPSRQPSNPRGGIVAVGNPNSPTPFPRWAPRTLPANSPAARPSRGTAVGATPSGKMAPTTARPAPTAPAATATPTAPVITRGTGDVGQTRTTPQAAPSRPEAAPVRQPQVTAPRTDTPRPEPRSAPRVDTPRSTPRMETPRPSPRMETPRPAPRMEAPRPMPRMEAPRSAPPSAAAPRVGGGGGSAPRSAPAGRTPH